MKELTIEEKARRYDEALEKARQLCAYPTTKPFISDLQDLFSELMESEDERIRKAIKKALQVRCDGSRIISDEPVTLEEAISWLEKQGEQTPSWSEEDSVILGLCVDAVSGYYNPDNKEKMKGWLYSLKDRVQPKQEWKQENTHDLTDFENVMMHIGDSFFGQYAGLDPNDTIAIKEQATLLLGLVPKQEWSEKDEYHKRQILRILKDNGCSQTLQEKTEKWIEERLKSLMPQTTWRPSDEQINALKFVMEDIEKDSLIYPVLNSVLEDLKKLREE